MEDFRANRAFVMGVIIALLLFSLPNNGIAHSIEEGLELGFGAGLDIENLNTHPSFVMIRSSSEPEETPDWIRGLEGHFMVIDSEKTTYIASIVPFIRYLGKERQGWKPFGEIGLGASISNHDEINGRQLGGKLMFTITAALGAEIRTDSLGLVTVSTKFIHYSNGGLYPFNQSYNAQFIVFSYLI